jgi:hypothetical protein
MQEEFHETSRRIGNFTSTATAKSTPAPLKSEGCGTRQKGMGKARVAAARKLGIRLWIMLRDEIDYTEFCRRGHQRRQCSGAACAGMLDGDSGLN